MGKKEDKVFAPIAQVFENIISTAAKELGRSANCDVSYSPNSAAWDPSINSEFKPDNGLILKKTTARPDNKHPHPLFDLVDLEEFKLHNNDESINDDVRRLMENISFLFYTDPCRLFSFGLTIEDANTRIWFFSKSHIAVSKPFDFIRDVGPLVHYVASISFATSEAAGFDPTVRRVAGTKPDNIQYEYLLADVWYKTVSSLSDFRTKSIVGPNSRIWHVQDERGADFVLKDYFLGVDALTEADIQQSILDGLNTVNPISAKIMKPEKFHEHFMPIHDCQILASGATRSFMRYPLPEEHDWFPVLRNASDPCIYKSRIVNASHPNTFGAPPTSMAPVPSPRYKISFEDRKQCRTLFRGIGQALHDVDDLRICFNSFAHVAKGLMYMFSAGMVHRDLSNGNIILLDGLARISDLEYALSLREERAAHVAKSGTPAFMAIEVSSRYYEFRVQVMEDKDDKRMSKDVGLLVVVGILVLALALALGFGLKTGTRLSYFLLPLALIGTASIATRMYKNRTKPPFSVPFSPGYLHDLESLWWMASWKLGSKISQQAQRSARFPSLLLDSRIQYHGVIFSPCYTRTRFFRSVFDEDAPCLFDYTFSVAVENMRSMRAALVNRYMEVEGKRNFPHNLLKPGILDLYTRFEGYLRDVAESSLDGAENIWTAQKKFDFVPRST